eukprot:jgi/Orpsp1_1/1181388/evm.model.c7180000077042.1
MMKNMDSYDICEDLLKTPANITFGQLLGICKTTKTELIKGLKNVKVDENMIVSLAEFQEVSSNFGNKDKIKEHDVAVVRGIINGHNASIFIDPCSNTNLITRKFLNQFVKNYQVIGKVQGKVRQAMIDDSSRYFDVVKLNVKIGKIEFSSNFRITEKEDPFYDAIISLKTQYDNNIIIDTSDRTIAIKDQDGRLVPIANIEDISTFHSQTLLCYMYEEPSIITSTLFSSLDNQNIIFTSILKENIIKEMTEKCKISQEEKDKFQNLLNKYNDVITVSSDDLEPSKLLPHHINLEENVKPIKQKPYKISQVQSTALKEELQKLIDKNLIEPSHSPWSSPVVLVQKKNGKWRLCIDFRKLNNVTVKDAYALPKIREIFDALKDAKIFSTIDLFSGYHQIPMWDEDMEKTSFTTKFGNYYFKVMPFGLTNAPATFQREMNRIFFKLINECVQIFIDDVIIYSGNFSNHLIDLSKVFEILRENKLKVNIEKCCFCQPEIDALGHRVTTDGLLPLSKKVESIKNAEFEWTNIQNQSFELLKNCLINAPILCYPKFDIPFIIRSDACGYGIGGVLLQLYNDNIEHPVYFISRSIKKSERNYSTTELEGTAAFYCLTQFEHYILGNPFRTILYTDHQPLVPIIKKGIPSTSKHQRWCNKFSQLQVDIIYRPGKSNIIADALSRIVRKDNSAVYTSLDNYNNYNNNITNNNNNNSNNNSNNNNNNYNNSNNNISLPNSSNFTQEENEKYISEFMLKFLNDKIVTIDNKLYFNDDNKLREIIDDPYMKIKIIAKEHRIGHEGINKTYERIKNKYYWKNLILDVKKYVSLCKICQLNKSEPTKKLEQYSTPVEAPFVRIGLDIIGPLKVTVRGNKYIIVCVDYFTKWVEAKPLDSTTAYDVTNFLIEVFSRHGTPQLIITDNGVQFTADYTKIFLDLYDTYIHFVSTYHPESNGLVENRNREIGKQLRNFSNDNENWDILLPLALWALRTSKSTSTGFSSFELLYGRTENIPLEINIRNTIEEIQERSLDEILMERFLEHAKWVEKAAKKMLGTIKYWESRRQENISMKNKNKYKVGDKVKVRNFQRTKLEPYFIGPFIIKSISWNTVKLQDEITGKTLERNVHIKNILPFKD